MTEAEDIRKKYLDIIVDLSQRIENLKKSMSKEILNLQKKCSHNFNKTWIEVNQNLMGLCIGFVQTAKKSYKQNGGIKMQKNGFC